jgi:hypothetical protein
MLDEELDIPEAGEIYAAANTPMYLIRRWRETPAVQALARRVSTAEVVARIKESLENPEKKLSDFASLLLLVVLGIKQDGKSIREVSQINNQGRWYSTIARILLQQTISTGYFHLSANNMIQAVSRDVTGFSTSLNTLDGKTQ